MGGSLPAVGLSPARAAMKILMVEDSKSVIEAVTGALTLRGHEVVIAETVKEATEQLWQTEWGGFDAVVIDHELPDGVGITVMRMFRGVPRERRPKTIYWSGLDRSAALAENGLEADVVMTKDKMPELLDLFE